MATLFLVILGAVFFVAYALPLAFVPMAWARVFRWREERTLTIYFGRCLGVVALAIMALVARAAFDPASHREVFDLLILVGGGMTLVHVYGALRRIQPWTEDAEIVLYALATLAAWMVKP